MAFDGQHIWYTDQDLRQLWELDPSDMSVIKGPLSLSFTPKDAGWLNGTLYIMGDDDVLRAVDTSTGAVLWQAAFPRSYCAGLAFGGGYMWVGTNAATGKLYKVVFTEPLGVSEASPLAEVKVLGGFLFLPEGSWEVEVYSVEGRLVERHFGASGKLPLPKGFVLVRVSDGRASRVLKGIID